MKSQMKVADRSGARLALLIGPMEHGAGQVTIRDLRSENFEQAQQTVALGDVVAAVSNLLTN
jgi:histidyl-tRNA synthetase